MKFTDCQRCRLAGEVGRLNTYDSRVGFDKLIRDVRCSRCGIEGKIHLRYEGFTENVADDFPTGQAGKAIEVLKSLRENM